MFYTLTSTNPKYDVMELKSLNDWFVVNQLKSVPNIVDVNPFGGPTREYQVQLDPGKLVSYGLSLAQVEKALVANNINAGGGFIERGEQALNVRAVGLMQTTDDIAATVVKVQNGTPVRVRDLGQLSCRPRKCASANSEKPFAKKTAPSSTTTTSSKASSCSARAPSPKPLSMPCTTRSIELNGTDGKAGLLPQGVKLVPHLDRSELMHHTTHTVLRNLTDGVLLVTLILFLFLGNVRSALIVAVTIPFSLLFAAILLDLRHIPANLLSLGALDFGMVVDGSVVMVENILRHTSFGNTKKTFMETIAIAAHEVQRPVFFARVIIIVSYLPIFTLQRVEGRLFSPMAWTVAFALLGALVFALAYRSRALQPSVQLRHQGMAQPRPRVAESQLRPLARLVLRSHEVHAGHGIAGLRGHACSSQPAESSAPNFSRTSTKAPSGCAARSRPAPVRPPASTWQRKRASCLPDSPK